MGFNGAIPSFFKFLKYRQILSRNRCSASINEVSFFKNIIRKKWNGVFSNIVKGWFIFFIYTNKWFWSLRTQRDLTPLYLSDSREIPLSSYAFMSITQCIRLLQGWTQSGIWTGKEKTYWTDHRNTSYSTYQPPSSSIGHLPYFPPHFIK